MTIEELKAAVLADRQASYVRLGGGYPVPLAGVVYWGAMAAVGFVAALDVKTWSAIAFVSSGLIFPLAVVFARVFGNRFLSDRTSVGSVVGPAFIGMLVFWPTAFAAYWTEPSLAPLILAIGMAIHWPVIGWSYGRPAPYIAHAVARTSAVFAIWLLLPAARTTLLPAAVALIYAVTAVVLVIDSRMLGRRLAA